MSGDVDTWMAVYVGDWDADTKDLSCEEDGAYFRLVRHYWRRGPPPDDNARLARIVGVSPARWRSMRGVLASFFVIHNGAWTHKRVEAELVDARDRHDKAVKAANARWGKRRGKRGKSDANAYAQASPEHMLDTCPSPSPSPEGDHGLSDNVIPLQGASADALPGDDPRRAQAEAMTDEERRAAQAELRELAATLRTKRMPE